jgi:hypothetical protein
MKMLLTNFLFSPALGTMVMTGGECSKYFIMGPSGYKDVMAHKDPDDPSMLGESGQPADDTSWVANKDPPYPDASPKYGCTPDAAHGISCGLTETANYLAVETCATMRFSFPATSSSTVWQMTNNDTFQACDFTGATEITAGGDMTTGDKYIDFPIDNDMLDSVLFFASEVGCDQGQKIAIAVVETIGSSYNEGYADGQNSMRIQHCDCDHKKNPEGGTEAYHMGYVAGCKAEMPDDLSCCNADTECRTSSRSSSYYGPSGCKKTHLSDPYKNGGSCIRKSDQKYMIEVAKEVYTKCTDAANKADCDDWKKGYTCPWFRTYNMGAWVFNTDIDGTDTCPTGDDVTGHFDPRYPAVPAIVTAASGCKKCLGSSSTYHGRCRGFCSKMLQRPAAAPDSKFETKACTSTTSYYCRDTTTGRGCKDTSTACEQKSWIGEGCDADKTIYTPHCDMWFMAEHCKDLSEGNITETIITDYASDPDAQLMIRADISKERCDSSKLINAYNKYSGDTKKWDDWLDSFEPTDAPKDAADESFTPTAAVGMMLALLAWK